MQAYGCKVGVCVCSYFMLEGVQESQLIELSVELCCYMVGKSVRTRAKLSLNNLVCASIYVLNLFSFDQHF